MGEYELLCFMDTNSGYNQVRMATGNEEKVAFITEGN